MRTSICSSVGAPSSPIDHAPNTSVISPIHSRSNAATTSSVPRTSSSCSFVSSRAMTTSRPGIASASRRRVRDNRLGDSNRTQGSRRFASSSTTPTSSPSCRGGKPAKKKGPSTSPDAATATVTAEGPGNDVTPCPAPKARRTKALPGSLTDGVPASVTSATTSPHPIQSITRSRSASVALASSR